MKNINEETMSALDKVNFPQDLKTLSLAELQTLADEIRRLLIYKIDATGGHFGPNLGFIEPTIALHYVFNSPTDQVVFDVSHQCYTHKILTGRKAYFTNPAKYHEISGYTNPQESEHDWFVVGHTSTAPSLAVGLAMARDLKKEHRNVIAVIGDGSLSGGEAFEGLDNAAALHTNLIIVVNDNEISIAPNHGGLYGNLALLRRTQGKGEPNFFKALGFDYAYVDDGNNLPSLIRAFEQVKDTPRPTVVHLHTLKGKGCAQAEQNKEAFHWILPGTLEGKNPPATQDSYDSITVDYFLKKHREDPSFIVLNPATPGAVALTPQIRAQLGEGFADVGIAEEHAVACASGLARAGAKPVLAVLSSFIQRAYDQLSQDLALNNNPAVVLVYGGSISGADATHLGCFDMALLGNIPNLVYLAPTSQEEYLAMLNWAVRQTEHAVAIRVPVGPLAAAGRPVATDYSPLNRFETVVSGREVALLGLGNFYHLAEQVHELLEQQLGIRATLINPRYISGVDRECLDRLTEQHRLVVTLEDGIVEGGFGQKVASCCAKNGLKVLNFGAQKEFTDRVPTEELYRRFHLTPQQIVQDVQNALK